MSEEDKNKKIENENEDLEEVEEMVESRYLRIPENAKQTLYVLRGYDVVMGKRRFRPIEKEYHGDKIDKVHADVFLRDDILSGNITEKKIKWFDMGKNSGRLFQTELKDGNQLLDVKHTGSEKQTLYIPTASNDPELQKAIAKFKPQLDALQPRHLPEEDDEDGAPSS